MARENQGTERSRASLGLPSKKTGEQTENLVEGGESTPIAFGGECRKGTVKTAGKKGGGFTYQKQDGGRTATALLRPGNSESMSVGKQQRQRNTGMEGVRKSGPGLAVAADPSKKKTLFEMVSHQRQMGGTALCGKNTERETIRSTISCRSRNQPEFKECGAPKDARYQVWGRPKGPLAMRHRGGTCWIAWG